MILVSQRKHKSLEVGSVQGVRMAAFSIVTGQNGAGKSNLLEALQNGAVVFDDLGQLVDPQVRLFRLGELLAATEGPVTPAAYKEPYANLWNNLQGWREHATTVAGLSGNYDQQVAWINNQVVSSNLLTQRALDSMVADAGKTLMDMTMQDIKKFAPLIAGKRDPFAASISEVFLSYEQRRAENEKAQWIKTTKGRGDPLTDTEFEARYGQPPWELLDETLRLVKLPYHFIPPVEDAETLNYEVTVLNERDEVIKPSDFSSGERVLLAVAMSLFTGSRMSAAIELPRLLLLDEPDASLHPSMVNSLLTVIEEVFVRQYGVRVVMTTHSPSTVALAAPDSLFVMSRDGTKLRSATADEALKMLTVGISSLSVRVENRRQVFVESEYDQAIYQDLFRVLKSQLTSDKTPVFIAAGKTGVGGGCEAVIRFVSELRRGGNTTVSGLIDRDNRKSAPAHVFYLADRYSIENLVFDPMLLGVLLLRENILTATDLGLAAGTRHFEITHGQGPAVVSAVSAHLNMSALTTAVTYADGTSIDIPSDFLNMQGHELETRVLAAFPQLKGFKTKLKQEIVNRAVVDRPQFVPRVLIDLFEQLLVD